MHTHRASRTRFPRGSQRTTSKRRDLKSVPRSSLYSESIPSLRSGLISARYSQPHERPCFTSARVGLTNVLALLVHEYKY
jgi:hypothetical protein